MPSISDRRSRYRNRNRPSGRRGGGGHGGAFGGSPPDSPTTYPFPDLTGPPLGTYDPALDYQRRASERGLLNLIEDTHRDQFRSRQDFLTYLMLGRRKLGRGLRDLRTSRSQNLADIARQQSRGVED